MRCPENYEVWLQETGDRDPRLTEHLAVCPHCRAEAEAAARLRTHLQRLPDMAVPAGVSASFRRLAEAAATETLSCDDVRDALEAWRDGTLMGTQAFLIEDHLLWCGACATELARAEQLTTALRGLPALDVPAAVAERVAAGRAPWWQRFLPAPAPSWRGFGVAVGAMAAGIALVFTSFSSVFRTPVLADKPNPIVTPFGPAVVTPPLPDPAPDTRTIARRPAVRVEVDEALPTLPPGTPDSVRQALLKQMRLNAVHAAPAAPKAMAPEAPAPAPADPMLAYRPEMKTEFTPAVRTDRSDSHVAYEPAVVASAREAMLRRALEDELASSEDALFTVPDNARLASSALPRHTARKPAAASPAGVDEVNKSLHDAVSRSAAPSALQPISVSGSRSKPTNELVLFSTK